jgi:hypothetical protein
MNYSDGFGLVFENFNYTVEIVNNLINDEEMRVIWNIYI